MPSCRSSGTTNSLIGLGARDVCGNWYRAGRAAALGDDARAVSLLPLNCGTTGTAHRTVIGETLQHYAPLQGLIKPRGSCAESSRGVAITA